MKINHQDLSFILQKAAVKKIFLLAFIGVIVFIYVWNLNGLPSNVHGDEGEIALQALQIISSKQLIGTGWFDLPLLSFVPHAITMTLFGPTISAHRFASVLFGLCTIAVFYFFVKELFGKSIAIISIILLSTSHMWLALSRLGLSNTQAAFLLVLTLYLFTRAVTHHSTKYFILSGIFAGISMYSYYGVRILPILLGLFALRYIIPKSHRRKRVKNILIFITVSLIVFSPQMKFYLDNPISFSSRSNSVFVLSDNGKQWSNYNKKSNIEILSTQIAKTFNVFAGDNSTQYGYKGLLIDFFSLLFVITGIVYSFFHIKKFKYFFILIWSFLAILGQILTTIPTPIFLPRFVVGLPVIFIFGGIGAYLIWKKVSFKPMMRNIFFIAIFSYITIYNFEAYFIEYPTQVAKGVAGGGIHELTPRKISEFINFFPKNHTFYFLTKPFLGSGYGTIRFLAKNSTRIDLDPSLNPLSLPNIKADASFIIYPEYESKLTEIKYKYPNGFLKKYTNYFNGTEFITYTIYSE